MARAPDLKKYPQELRDSIKARYLEFEPVAEISRSTGVNETIIWIWAKTKGWTEQRDRAIIEHKNDTVKVLKRRFNAVINLSLPAIHNSIAIRLKNIQKEPLTISEVKQLSEVVWNWYDHMRVDEGLPTEIIHAKGALTQKEIINILKKDKFFNLEGIKDVTSDGTQGEAQDGEREVGASSDSPVSGGTSGDDGEQSSDVSDGSGNGGTLDGTEQSGVGEENSGDDSTTEPDTDGSVEDPGGEASPMGSTEGNAKDPFS